MGMGGRINYLQAIMGMGGIIDPPQHRPHEAEDSTLLDLIIRTT